MFKNFLRNKKGQNTAEYALLIALVVAGIIAMQQYAQRALQARVRDAGVYMADATHTVANGDTSGVVLGASKQYEPYYQKSDYTVSRDSTEHKINDGSTVSQDSTSDRGRTGSQSTEYTNTVTTDTTNADMPTGI